MRDIHTTTAGPDNTFWGELSGCDHCVQFYESDAAFLDTLEAFTLGGFQQGDAIIVIGTPPHRQALEARLQENGIDLAAASARDQLISLDAATTLQRFMVNGWPDPVLFEQLVAELLARARAHHPKVRAFGEMVALMWAAGLCDATVRLENMWSHLCARESFSLFCAYPKTGFAEDVTEAMAHICAAHSKVYVL
jgi:lambda repressor-like predicted transcriptional regulator